MQESHTWWGLVVILVSIAGLAIVSPGQAQTVHFDMALVAEENYVHFGLVALTTPENRGDIANLGVVIGLDAVAIIDTGGSVAVGRALLEAVRFITDKPIRYVINTHEHPDHIFGNAAFLSTGAVFVGHHNLPNSIAAHGEFYVRSFATSLGSEAVSEVRLVKPTLLIDKTMQLDLGHHKLLLTAWGGSAHSDCDLTVLDETTDTLFGGDLVFVDHIPVLDGSIKGWLSLMPALAALPAKRVVPGHGRRIAAWPQALADERHYLETVQTDTRRLIGLGRSMEVALPLIGVSERGQWALFDDYHLRNATTAFAELEWE